MQPKAAQHSAAQPKAAQHSTAQCSAAAHLLVNLGVQPTNKQVGAHFLRKEQQEKCSARCKLCTSAACEWAPKQQTVSEGVFKAQHGAAGLPRKAQATQLTVTDRAAAAAAAAAHLRVAVRGRLVHTQRLAEELHHVEDLLFGMEADRTHVSRHGSRNHAGALPSARPGRAAPWRTACTVQLSNGRRGRKTG